MADKRSVAIILSGTSARARAVALFQNAGYATVICERPDQVLHTARSRSLGLVVYDLVPGNSTTERGLQSIRQAAPDVPILIYYPPIPGLDAVANYLSGRARVTIALQGTGPNEDTRLHELLDLALRRGTAGTVLLVMSVILPEEHLAVHRFVEEAVWQLSTSRTAKALKVGVLSARTGIAVRTIERACSEARVPAPHDLVGWVLLLHCCASAEGSGSTTARAAGDIGLRREGLYRLRHRLLSPESKAAFKEPKEPAAEFNATVRDFAAECSVGVERAEQALTAARA